MLANVCVYAVWHLYFEYGIVCDIWRLFFPYVIKRTDYFINALLGDMRVYFRCF